MPPKLNAPQANHGRGALIDIQTVRLHFPEERNTLFALGPTASTGVSLDGTWQYRQTIEFYKESPGSVKPEQPRSGYAPPEHRYLGFLNILNSERHWG
jgi:hypothetical protein